MTRAFPFSTITCASLAAALAMPSAAQTLSGVVKGAGSPVVGATVRILGLDRAERTGVGGRYEFQRVPKGRYRVFAGLIGFASHVDTLEISGESTTADFDLKVSAIPREEVVVSASPYARTADDQYQSAESKGLVEFQDSPGANYADKLSDLPGVTVRGNGPAPSRPILRGLSDNRVLVLENGLRNGDISTYDPAHATPIEAIGVSQVDVVRGPASILYGPSTIGGLVNVITNIVPSVADRPVSGTVNVEGNSVSDLYSGYLNAVYSSGHGALGVFAGGTHTQDIRVPSGTYVDPGSGAGFNLERMPQSFDHSSEGGLGYTYQGDFGSVGVGMKHFEINYGIPGVPPNADWIDVPPPPRASPRAATPTSCGASCAWTATC